MRASVSFISCLNAVYTVDTAHRLFDFSVIYDLQVFNMETFKWSFGILFSRLVSNLFNTVSVNLFPNPYTGAMKDVLEAGGIRLLF